MEMLKSPTHSEGFSFKMLLKLGRKVRGLYSPMGEKRAQLIAIQRTWERIVSEERYCYLGQGETSSQFVFCYVKVCGTKLSCHLQNTSNCIYIHERSDAGLPKLQDVKRRYRKVVSPWTSTHAPQNFPQQLPVSYRHATPLRHLFRDTALPLTQPPQQQLYRPQILPALFSTDGQETQRKRAAELNTYSLRLTWVVSTGLGSPGRPSAGPARQGRSGGSPAPSARGGVEGGRGGAPLAAALQQGASSSPSALPVRHWGTAKSTGFSTSFVSHEMTLIQDKITIWKRFVLEVWERKSLCIYTPLRRAPPCCYPTLLLWKCT